jgi:hypothetical protein
LKSRITIWLNGTRMDDVAWSLASAPTGCGRASCMSVRRLAEFVAADEVLTVTSVDGVLKLLGGYDDDEA